MDVRTTLILCASAAVFGACDDRSSDMLTPVQLAPQFTHTTEPPEANLYGASTITVAGYHQYKVCASWLETQTAYANVWAGISTTAHGDLGDDLLSVSNLCFAEDIYVNHTTGNFLVAGAIFTHPDYEFIDNDSIVVTVNVPAPPLDANIDGPWETPTSVACTYQAVVNGGTAPYSYSWSGLSSGSSISVNAVGPGTLYLTVTDSGSPQQQDSAEFQVGVDSRLEECMY